MSSLSPLVVAMESGAGAWPFIIAGGILAFLVLAVMALLSFGRGREHS